MSLSVHNLLQQINLLEAEIEIQKQILFSLEENEKDAMKETIAKIASAKKEIEGLKQSIREVSPTEFDRIEKIETATKKVRDLAADGRFTEIKSMAEGKTCPLLLSENRKIDCLIRAKESGGNYTVITIDGDFLTIDAKEVISAE